MSTYTAVIERCRETGLYIGYVPGFPAAHSQGETLEELNLNLHEVLAMMRDEGSPARNISNSARQMVEQRPQKTKEAGI